MSESLNNRENEAKTHSSSEPESIAPGSDNSEAKVSNSKSPERNRYANYQIELNRSVENQLAELAIKKAKIPPVVLNGSDLHLFKYGNDGYEFRQLKFERKIKKYLKKREFVLNLPGINLFLDSHTRKQGHKDAYEYWLNYLTHIILYIAEGNEKKVAFTSKMTDANINDPSKIPGLALNVTVY